MLKAVLVALAVFGLRMGPKPNTVADRFTTENQRIWDLGGVCRNASAHVWRLAREENLEAVILHFETSSPRIQPSHAIPAVRIGDWWYLFESSNGRSKYKRSKRILDECGELTRFTGRSCIPGTEHIMYAPHPYWNFENLFVLRLYDDEDAEGVIIPPLYVDAEDVGR